MNPSRAPYYFFKKKERKGGREGGRQAGSQAGRQAGQVSMKMLCYMKLNSCFHQRLLVFNMLMYSVNLQDKAEKQSAV